MLRFKRHSPTSGTSTSMPIWKCRGRFEFGKDHFGLDQCQARLHTAIQRHTALVMAALAAARLKDRTDTQAPPPNTPDQPPPTEPGMIPLTVPEIKRLLATALQHTKPPDHHTYWRNWRRRHQARAHWHHQRTRLNRDYALIN